MAPRLVTSNETLGRAPGDTMHPQSSQTIDAVDKEIEFESRGPTVLKEYEGKDGVIKKFDFAAQHQ